MHCGGSYCHGQGCRPVTAAIHAKQFSPAIPEDVQPAVFAYISTVTSEFEHGCRDMAADKTPEG